MVRWNLPGCPHPCLNVISSSQNSTALLGLLSKGLHTDRPKFSGRMTDMNPSSPVVPAILPGTSVSKKHTRSPKETKRRPTSLQAIHISTV